MDFIGAGSQRSIHVSSIKVLTADLSQLWKSKLLSPVWGFYNHTAFWAVSFWLLCVNVQCCWCDFTHLSRIRETAIVSMLYTKKSIKEQYCKSMISMNTHQHFCVCLCGSAGSSFHHWQWADDKGRRCLVWGGTILHIQWLQCEHDPSFDICLDATHSTQVFALWLVCGPSIQSTT